MESASPTVDQTSQAQAPSGESSAAAHRVGTLFDLVERILHFVDDWQDDHGQHMRSQAMQTFGRVSKLWFDAWKHVSLHKIHFRRNDVEGPIRLLHTLQLGASGGSQRGLSIRRLNLNSLNDSIRISTIAPLVQACANLEKLSFGSLRVLLAYPELLEHHERLRKLSLYGQGFRALCKIGKFPIGSTSGEGHSNISDPAISPSFKLPTSLHRLILRRTDVCLSPLASMPTLMELQMQHCTLHTAWSGVPDSRWFHHLQRVTLADVTAKFYAGRAPDLNQYPHLDLFLRNVQHLSISMSSGPGDFSWLESLDSLTSLEMTLPTSYGHRVELPTNLSELSILAGHSDRLFLTMLLRLQDPHYLPKLSRFPDLSWKHAADGWSNPRTRDWVRALFEHHLLAIRDLAKSSLLARDLVPPQEQERGLSIWNIQAMAFDQVLDGSPDDVTWPLPEFSNGVLPTATPPGGWAQQDGHWGGGGGWGDGGGGANDGWADAEPDIG